MSGHDFTTCDCSDCRAALLDLQVELEHLERVAPDVRAAAESYDRMVERITGRRRSALVTCPHDWIARGVPDDEWRECWLCGEVSDR